MAKEGFRITLAFIVVYAYVITMASVFDYAIAQEYLGELTVALTGALTAWLQTRGKTSQV